MPVIEKEEYSVENENRNDIMKLLKYTISCRITKLPKEEIGAGE